MKRFPISIRNSGNTEAVLDQTRILVSFKKEVKDKEVQVIAKELGLKLESTERDTTGKHWIRINNTARRYWLRSVDNSNIDDEHFNRIQKGLGAKINWIGPVYRQTSTHGRNDYFSPLPNVLLYRKSKKDDVRQIAKSHGLKINDIKSKYLTNFYYLEIDDPKRANAYEITQNLDKRLGDVAYENMPMFKPLTATIPNDTHWTEQWNLDQINGPDAWDISTGGNTVVVAVLDEGVDLTHPDLQFSEDGVNLDTMMPTGAPTGPHGTACAGIAAATFNNSAGVAGIAGGCLIMPLAFQNWTDVECANGINYAATNGADVLSMSFGVYGPGEGPTFGWNMATVDPEILNAFNNDVVMCAATGNEDDGNFNRYPGRHALVIGVGGSSTDDNRKTPASPDGECWGANFGEDVHLGEVTGVSVVAPCVQCPTTDWQGSDGYNNNGTLISNPWACVMYPAQPANGDYVMVFDGTSAATPHVAGMAALLRSEYPTLTNVQIRNIIERSAAKVGAIAYAENPDFPNGTRNQEMGYGRLDLFRALDFADTMIKDWPGDTGVEPSTPAGGNFWDFADIVTRITDDNVFNPANPTQSKNVERGQTNYIYVQVTNNGPRDARNVSVTVRITPYVGLQFVYPNDWTAVDAMHVSPTSITNNFASVPAGTTVIAKFSISSAQVEDLYGWQTNNPWHPCLLAQVTSDNDYAFASADLSFGNIVLRKNDFAQRNLTVIDVLASPGASPSLAFPFVAGNRFNRDDFMRLNIDRSRLPKKAKVTLNLADQSRLFPLVDFDLNGGGDDKDGESIIFQNKTSVITRLGCCDVRLTLEKNSKLEMLCGRRAKLKVKSIKGGDLLTIDGEQSVRITDDKASVDLDIQPGALYALSVRIDFPNDLKREEIHSLVVSQSDETDRTLGGATAMYKVV